MSYTCYSSFQAVLYYIHSWSFRITNHDANMSPINNQLYSLPVQAVQA